MLLSEIRDWLKVLFGWTTSWTIGKLDTTKEQTMCLYNQPDRSGSGIAVGGPSNTRSAVKKVNLVLRWGMDANVAEIKANELYAKLLIAKSAVIGSKNVYFVRLSSPGPIPLDTDSNGVYEYLIEMEIFHERS